MLEVEIKLFTNGNWNHELKSTKFEVTSISFTQLVIHIFKSFGITDFELFYLESENTKQIQNEEQLQSILNSHPKRISINTLQKDVQNVIPENNIVKITQGVKYKKNGNLRYKTGEYFSREKMKFIGEVGNINPSTQEPRAIRITRTLRILNNGKDEWPEGTMLIPTRINKSHHIHFKTTSVCFPMPCKIQPNQYVDISIPLFVPVACDCYSASWKLISPLYTIGPTIGFTINAIDHSSS